MRFEGIQRLPWEAPRDGESDITEIYLSVHRVRARFRRSNPFLRLRTDDVPYRWVASYCFTRGADSRKSCSNRSENSSTGDIRVIETFVRGRTSGRQI